MTLTMCDQVAERIALGEPIAELSEHAATCSSCRGVIAMPTQLVATRHAVDPGLGFSARMTVGAQHLLTVRRRRRVAAGLAAAVASGAFAVFAVTRTPTVAEPPRPTVATQDLKPDTKLDPRLDPPTEVTDDDLTAIVQLADVDQSMRMSAQWRKIKKPLAPYKKLLKGVEP
jgi:hypothetical protein